MVQIQNEQETEYCVVSRSEKTISLSRAVSNQTEVAN